MNALDQYITLDSTEHNTFRYILDVRAAACEGFSDFYEEAVWVTRGRCAFTFMRDGVMVGYTQHF